MGGVGKMSKPFGQSASLKKAEDEYQRSRFSATVFKDEIVIFDNHLGNSIDQTYWTSEYTPAKGQVRHPLVWKQEGDTWTAHRRAGS